MMNLGQKVDGAHEKENGSDNNKEPEQKIEGEEYTAGHLLLLSGRKNWKGTTGRWMSEAWQNLLTLFCCVIPGRDLNFEFVDGKAACGLGVGYKTRSEASAKMH